MNEEMLKRATVLADRPYQKMRFLDRSTDGADVYFALVPELPGCHTHGSTVDEAEELLNEVIVEFIYFMLEDGLDIPPPRPIEKPFSVNFGEHLHRVVEAVPDSPIPRGALIPSSAQFQDIVAT